MPHKQKPEDLDSGSAIAAGGLPASVSLTQMIQHYILHAESAAQPGEIDTDGEA